MAITFDENWSRMQQASQEAARRTAAATNQANAAAQQAGQEGQAAGQQARARKLGQEAAGMSSSMPSGPSSPYPNRIAAFADQARQAPSSMPPGPASAFPQQPAPPAPPGLARTAALGQQAAGMPSTPGGMASPYPNAPEAVAARQAADARAAARGATAPTPYNPPTLLPEPAPNGSRLAATGVAAGVAGGLGADLVNRVRQGQLDSAPKMALRPDAPGQIPVNPADVAPPAAAGSFLNQSEAGRNFGNAVNAVTPGLRAMAGVPGMAVDGLTRAGAALGKLPQLERAAQPAALAGAAVKGYVAGDAAFPGQARAAPAPEALRQPYTDPLGGDRGGSAAAVAPKVDLAGKIVKGTDANGNATYSGSNVKFGADIVDQDGKVLNTSDPNNPNWRNSFGVSGGGSAPGAAGQSGLAGSFDAPGEANRVEQRLAAQYAAERANAPGPTYTPTSSELGIKNYANGFSDPEARSREIDFKQSLRDMSPRMRAQAVMQERQLQKDAAIAADGQAVQRRGQDIGASTTLRGQDIGASTSRYGTDVNASTQRRGQDFDLAGREATLRGQSRGNDIAAQRLQYDMATGERKWMAERGDKSLEQRAARETQLQKKFEDLAVTGQDDKGGRIVDQNLVAHHRQQFERAAATMGLNGMHELSNTDEQRLLQASHLLNKVNGVGGVLPWKADTLKTMDASDLIGLKKDPNSGDYVVANPKSRVRGAVIPKHLVEGEKATNWPMAGLNTSATTRYRDLIMGDTR